MDDPLISGPAVSIERRVSARVDVAWLSGVVQLRLPPGREAVLLNLSRDGACIEAGSRLLPGGRVEVHLSTQGWNWRGRAMVTRCHVSALVPDDGARYLAALHFATPLASDEPATLMDAARDAVVDGYVLPGNTGGANRKWAVTTRETLLQSRAEAERSEISQE
jgi:hypothetical protein